MCILPLVNPGSVKMDKGTCTCKDTGNHQSQAEKKEELVTWKKSFKIFENGGNKLKKLKLTQ